MKLKSDNKFEMIWAAALALWLRLRQPSFDLGFESQAHHVSFFLFV